MVICKECGNSTESTDGFCPSCGVLLEWSGQPVTAAGRGGQALASRQPVAERARPGAVPMAAEPAYGGPYCSACGVRNPAGRSFCRSCGEMLRPGAVTTEPAARWWRRLVARLTGRRAYAAGDRPRGFLSHDPTPRAAAGAPATGAPSRPAGHPAMPGQSAGAPVPTPSSRSPRQAAGAPALSSPSAAAGQRIHRANQSRRILLSRFAPLIVVASLLGIGLGPARTWLETHVIGIEHHTQAELSQQYVNIVPIRASASSAAQGHGGMLAIDGVQQTYWLTGGSDGTGASLRIVFAGPQDIQRVGLLSGEPGGSYTTEARPRTIEIVAAGHPSVSLSFEDTAGFQNRPVSLPGVRAITAVITSVYPGQQGQSVAIRELEFFTKA
jgi:hypothetical protein